MKRPTCETCIHWSAGLLLTHDGSGLCGRHPPQHVGGDVDEWYSWAQPLTAAAEYCGEHHDFPAYLAWHRQQADVAPPAAEA